jgi:cytochrome c oxidase assembly protein subunit 15
VTFSSHNSLTHRLAVALVCVVFPLIWVGGLVTTYDAGMAVPDWPGTYGYNLLLYPWTTWIAGPFDLFIEHGHRLLGATAGFVSIALVISAYVTKQSPLVRNVAIGALLLVIAQGGLGGARVLLNDRQIALIHGCVGPLFFAYCVAAAVMTSPRWRALTKVAERNASLSRSTLMGLLLAYAQLVLGAFLRHPSDVGSSRMFQLVLLFHVVVALALTGHITALAVSTFVKARQESWVLRPALALVALLLVQLGLGLATFIVKYGWPAWLGGELLNPSFTVSAQGFWSSMIVTAHVANGSLILAFLTTLWLRSLKLFGWGFSSPVRGAKDGQTSIGETGPAPRLRLSLGGAQ